MYLVLGSQEGKDLTKEGDPNVFRVLSLSDAPVCWVLPCGAPFHDSAEDFGSLRPMKPMKADAVEGCDRRSNGDTVKLTCTMG